LVQQSLETLGIDVQSTDYNEVNAIEQVVRECDFVLLVPPMQQQQPMQWIQEAERIIQAAKNARVKGMVMVSFLGCDCKPEKKQLAAYEKVEKKVKEMFGNQQFILRVHFGQQHFRLVTADIQQRGELRMPIGEGAFSPLDFEDVAKVIAKTIKGEREIPSEHRQQVYSLNGPTSMTGRKLAQELTNVTQRSVTFQSVQRDEAQDRIMSNWRKIAGQPSAFAPRDGPYAINESYVDLIMDMCDLVKEGKIPAVGTDVQRLTGEEPTRVERLFREDSLEFKGSN